MGRKFAVKQTESIFPEKKTPIPNPVENLRFLPVQQVLLLLQEKVSKYTNK